MNKINMVTSEKSQVRDGLTGKREGKTAPYSENKTELFSICVMF